MGGNLSFFAVNQTLVQPLHSTFKWPNMLPNTNDWQTWHWALGKLNHASWYLIWPLGEWMDHSHRVWEWFLIKSSEEVVQVQGWGTWHMALTGIVQAVLPEGAVPCSV